MKNLGLIRIVLLLLVTVTVMGDFTCRVVVQDGSSTEVGDVTCLIGGKLVGDFPLDPTGTADFFVPVPANQRTVMTCFISLGSSRFGKFNLFDSNVDAAICAPKGALFWRYDQNGVFVLSNRQFVKLYSWP